jgi:hypothetical protein
MYYIKTGIVLLLFMCLFVFFSPSAHSAASTNFIGAQKREYGKIFYLVPQLHFYNNDEDECMVAVFILIIGIIWSDQQAPLSNRHRHVSSSSRRRLVSKTTHERKR